MSSYSVGDLARNLQLRIDQARIQSDMLRLSNELATGRKSDLGAAIFGDFGPLVGLDADLRRLDAYDTTVTEAILLTGAAQTALEVVQTNTVDLAAGLLLVQDAVNPRTIDNIGAEARQSFDSVVAALNQTVGDKSIFAGAAIDRPPLASPDVILAALSALIAPETTAAGVQAALDAWFAPGGDFETLAYLGSTTARADIRLNPETTVAFEASATDLELREILKAFAMGALLNEGALGTDAGARADLAELAGETLLTAETGLIDVRSAIGRSQEAIDKARIRNQAERATLEIARFDIVKADPFETAAQLEAIQTQLETLYAVTARLSQLSLTNYLR